MSKSNKTSKITFNGEEITRAEFLNFMKGETKTEIKRLFFTLCIILTTIILYRFDIASEFTLGLNTGLMFIPVISNISELIKIRKAIKITK